MKRRRSEGRKQKAEGRRQKAEGRRQKAEVNEDLPIKVAVFGPAEKLCALRGSAAPQCGEACLTAATLTDRGCASTGASRRRLARSAFCFLPSAFCLLLSAFCFLPSAAAQDYSKFLHTSAKHTSIACSSCHRRNDNSVRPSRPGHKDCTGCHLTQFTTPNIPMCSICHQDVNGADPPRKAFPDRFTENFNVKFDHAQHMTGNAKPKSGCIACHSSPLRRGVALSIPAGLEAHSGCYSCHTPGAQANGRDLASCGVCHAAQAYTRTSTDSPAYRVSFSHAQHTTRQRLNCSDCHNYTAGLPQRRQISSPRAQEHFPNGNSCATCHNGRRTFGGDADFKACRRCHTGSTFRTGA